MYAAHESAKVQDQEAMIELQNKLDVSPVSLALSLCYISPSVLYLSFLTFHSISFPTSAGGKLSQ